MQNIVAESLNNIKCKYSLSACSDGSLWTENHTLDQSAYCLMSPLVSVMQITIINLLFWFFLLYKIPVPVVLVTEKKKETQSPCVCADLKQCR